MRKMCFGLVAATLVWTAPAVAEPCMYDLEFELYPTEGQCEAAIVRKRNEMRQYFEMRGNGNDQAGFPPPAGTFNDVIADWLSCERTDSGWVVSGL